MASVLKAAGVQATLTRPSIAPAVVSVHRKAPMRGAALQAFVSQPAPLKQAEDSQKNMFDLVVSSVLSLFDDSQPQQASEELQLPPELKAYLEEIESQEGGSHGGWVHSHIAERLASTESISD